MSIVWTVCPKGERTRRHVPEGKTYKLLKGHRLITLEELSEEYEKCEAERGRLNNEVQSHREGTGELRRQIESLEDELKSPHRLKLPLGMLVSGFLWGLMF